MLKLSEKSMSQDLKIENLEMNNANLNKNINKMLEENVLNKVLKKKKIEVSQEHMMTTMVLD